MSLPSSVVPHLSLATTVILVRGGGDLATGVAHRLHTAGFMVVITELPQPLAVRRGAAFAEAVYAGSIMVEGLTAHFSPNLPATLMRQSAALWVTLDQGGEVVRQLHPPVVVDARLAKQPLDTRLTDAPLVIALGPGFVVGEHCHAVIETNRGHDLGRVYWTGSAQPDTGQPEPVRGFTGQRVLRAPADGVFTGRKQIGDAVQQGETLAEVGAVPLLAPFTGVVRGLLHDGVQVTAGLKVGDLDPRGTRHYCFTISDKARAIGGGVLEAILKRMNAE